MNKQQYWHKQGNEPLFPDMIWSRPETAVTAGKLLIVGGNAHGFSAPALAFSTAVRSGIGVVRVLLPDALKQYTKMLADNTGLLPSTPSGSFAKSGLSDLLLESEWADGILLSGDVGKNSETAILLEAFTQKYTGLLTVSGDTVDVFYAHSESLLDRSNSLVVAKLQQLQKLVVRAGHMVPVYQGMSLTQLVEALHIISTDYKASFITMHQNHYVISVNGQIATAIVPEGELPNWQVLTASRATVWWLQNPTKPFEATATALFSSATSKS